MVVFNIFLSHWGHTKPRYEMMSQYPIGTFGRHTFSKTSNKAKKNNCCGCIQFYLFNIQLLVEWLKVNNNVLSHVDYVYLTAGKNTPVYSDDLECQRISKFCIFWNLKCCKISVFAINRNKQNFHSHILKNTLEFTKEKLLLDTSCNCSSMFKW